MPLEFSRMSSERLLGLEGSKTVFLIPLSPLEDHGPHLPLGADVTESVALARMIGERIEKEMPGWAAVLLPAIPVGADSDTTEVSLRVRGQVVRDLLVDACTSLARNGFVHFAAVTANVGPRQLTAIEEAGTVLARRHLLLGFRRLLTRAPAPRLLSVMSALAKDKGWGRSAFFADPVEHAGERDTSVMLHLDPSSVWPQYSALPPAEADGSWISRLSQRMARRRRSYWGDPAKASAERGAGYLDSVVARVFPELRAVWEGAPPRSRFRSWYSVIPSNTIYFRAWALFTVGFIVMVAWMLYLLRNLGV